MPPGALLGAAMVGAGCRIFQQSSLTPTDGNDASEVRVTPVSPMRQLDRARGGLVSALRGRHLREMHVARPDADFGLGLVSGLRQPVSPISGDQLSLARTRQDFL